MNKDLIKGVILFLIVAIGYYYFTHTAEEIMTHILYLVTGIGGGLLFLAWFKTALEELDKAGSRAIRNFFNRPTPILENAYQNSTENPWNDRENTVRSSTEASTAKTGQTIRVSQQKREQIKNEVIKFLTEKTKGGKLWLELNNNINNYLNELAKICEVEKIVIVRTIESYPEEFKIYEGYAYSVTAYDEKLRATREAKRETEVHFDATEPDNKETSNQSEETTEEVFA
jgi:hypothetical protein